MVRSLVFIKMTGEARKMQKLKIGAQCISSYAISVILISIVTSHLQLYFSSDLFPSLSNQGLPHLILLDSIIIVMSGGPPQGCSS
jgi:hypothetical protein